MRLHILQCVEVAFAAVDTLQTSNSHHQLNTARGKIILKCIRPSYLTSTKSPKSPSCVKQIKVFCNQKRKKKKICMYMLSRVECDRYGFVFVQTPRLTQNQEVYFVPSLKICTKTSKRTVDTKSVVTPFITSTLRTHTHTRLLDIAVSPCWLGICATP